MKNMITVVHFIHGLNMGGAETLVKNYALMLDKSKFRVIVLCYEHYNTSPYEELLKQNGIHTIFVCDEMPLYGKKGIVAKLINRIQRYLFIRKKLRKIGPDIIHFHLPLSDYIKFARPKKNTKLFYTQHFNAHHWKETYPTDIKNMAWLKKHYSFHMIALNQLMKHDIDQMFSINDTYILNNGVDLSLFNGNFSKHEKRAELKIPQSAFVVVHVGRFHPIKNHDFLVDTFMEIKKRRDNALLLMVGTGETEAKIVGKLNDYSLNGSYKILHDRMDVAEILRASDAALFPSISEGLGIAVIEMQAAGLPCIVSTAVPKDTKISNKICYMDLNEPASKWADKLLELSNEKSPVQYTNLAEWDIRENVRQLEKLYEGA